ncbi:MAG TPA: hypothetical protein VJN92_15620 [Candidatus Acidoferrum sp.]|nr:hypothetical protein [Candidatus Acidoferrum sp.]
MTPFEYRTAVLTLLGLQALLKLADQGALVCERLHNTATWLMSRRRPRFYLRTNLECWQGLDDADRKQILREAGFFSL